MVWSAPRSYTTGEIITAAILNAHVRDNLLETSPAKVTTAGDTLVATGANALKRLALGTAAQALSVNSGGTDVEWADVATQAELDAHIAAATIDHPDSSVNDTKLGNRTADPAIATAYALAGTLTQHLSWLTKNIKALKGVAGNWWDAASATIEGIWAKFDASTGHKHTGAAGDAPPLGAKGTWSDTATVIAGSGTYTKTIALGYAATRGHATILGAPSGSYYSGAEVQFTATQNDACAAFSNAGGYRFIGNRGLNSAVTYENPPYVDHVFGNNISLLDCYISGTDLLMTFKNLTGINQTLNVNLAIWEVE